VPWDVATRERSWAYLMRWMVRREESVGGVVGSCVQVSGKWVEFVGEVV
jgi:hypothetical protein